MSTDKELYLRKPRLYRVALELSKFDNPHKALDLLLFYVRSFAHFCAYRYALSAREHLGALSIRRALLCAFVSTASPR